MVIVGPVMSTRTVPDAEADAGPVLVARSESAFAFSETPAVAPSEHVLSVTVVTSATVETVLIAQPVPTAVKLAAVGAWTVSDAVIVHDKFDILVRTPVAAGLDQVTEGATVSIVTAFALVVTTDEGAVLFAASLTALVAILNQTLALFAQRLTTRE